MLTQTQEPLDQKESGHKERYREVLESAEKLYRQDPDWVTFFRETLGVDGTVRKAFPTFDDLTKFEKSEEFDSIQKLVVRLREKRSAVDMESEPTRVITVRLPKSMHEYLRTEAHDLRTSMNKLCISKLLQVIDEGMIPNERSSESNGSATPKREKPEPSLQVVGGAGAGNSTFGVRSPQGGSPSPFGASSGFGGQQPQFKPQPRF